MISKVSISNFKVFKDQVDFKDLKYLNFLTGINGRGKSTMLQAFIALAQSIKENGNFDLLCLNGDMVNLGNSIDVKNEEISREKEIVLSFTREDTQFDFVFSVVMDNEQALRLKELRINGSSSSIDSYPEEIKSLFKNLIFISAERLGPQLHYAFNNDMNYIGSKGEYVACAFYNHKDDVVNKIIIDGIPDIFPEINLENIDPTLGGQVQFWLSQMFRPTYVNAEYIASVNEYTLRFGAPDRSGKYKPTNVGFGYSYVLPILVAALLAKPDSIFIIENPEAHLHPQAQSILSKFLALVSKTGVQIFIETHSEHIINAARVMIVQESFKPDDLRILYFDEKFPQKHIPIEVLSDGRISEWPEGFFDQSELDNDIILGL